jgi:signal transduction histidine kinase
MSTPTPSPASSSRLEALIERVSGGKPLASTLSAVSIVAALVALMMSAAGMLLWDIHVSHQSALRSTGEHTAVIAANISAAVSFRDEAETARTLDSLRSIPGVEVARVWDSAGKPIATFIRDEASGVGDFPESPPLGLVDSGSVLRRVESVRAILAGGNVVGFLYVRDDQSSTRARVRDGAISLLFAIPLATLVSLALARRLHRVVGTPLDLLTRITADVSARNNYSVRATPRGARELQSLANGLNHMLARVEERDAQLESARADLVLKVEQRTAHLKDSLQQMQLSNDALQASRAELAHQKALLDNVVSVIPYRLYWKDREGRMVWCNAAFAADLGCKDPAALFGRTDLRNDKDGFVHCLAQGDKGITATGTPEIHHHLVVNPDAERKQHLDVTRLPMADAEGNITGMLGVYTDVTEQMEAQAERERLLAELNVASRQAGMAEVATGVLHNVGNILNSVNVSATALSRLLRESKAPSVSKVATLLGEHRADLPSFLNSDERGRLLPDYLTKLGQMLESERDQMVGEITSLHNGVEHIKTVITTQQTYARSSTLIMPVRPAEIFEEALHVSQAARNRHSISVEKNFQNTGPLLMDKHKVLQILVNLIANAERAVKDHRIDQNPRRISLTLSLVPGPEDNMMVRLAVKDSGVGISSENLAKLFRHGFTTKADGHGFGLHASANAAKEMGGRIMGHSEGPGLGAEFVLEIPAKLAEVPK